MRVHLVLKRAPHKRRILAAASAAHGHVDRPASLPMGVVDLAVGCEYPVRNFQAQIARPNET